MKYLVETRKADVNIRNKSGTSSLILACGNEDSDPKIVRYLLEYSGVDVNRQITSQTRQWKTLRAVARVSTHFMKSKLMRRVAESGGLTALHYAARRGDVEIVELLMIHGANTSLKNDLGRDVLSYCENFPAIEHEIERVRRELSRVEEDDRKNTGGGRKRSKSFTLQRRLSTATPVKYDMYLINLSTVLKLFGCELDRKKNIHLSHKDFLGQGDLTLFEDLPMGAFVMYVSHQWNGYKHPDPNGRHLQVLCKVLRDLRDGVHDHVSTDPFHELLYKENTTTSAAEWQHLLSNAYIWFDFWCEPHHDTSLRKELNLAIESVAAYVERSDTVCQLCWSVTLSMLKRANIALFLSLSLSHTYIYIRSS